jgi:hypothetical protein
MLFKITIRLRLRTFFILPLHSSYDLTSAVKHSVFTQHSFGNMKSLNFY